MYTKILLYEPETGILRWKKSPSNNVKELSIAGGLGAYGYTRLSVNGQAWLAHRLIWVMFNGSIPAGMDIDHINGVRNDNRIENLRLATRSENNQNQRRAKSNNKNGLLGVTFHKHSGLFNSRISIDGSTHSLGYFKTPLEAHSAYIQRKREIHPANTI